MPSFYSEWSDSVDITLGSSTTAAFSAAPTGISKTVQFTDESTGTVTAWFWTFGDGSTSSDQNPIHYYAASGIYIVTLMVSNGSSDTISHLILVKSAGSCLISILGRLKLDGNILCNGDVHCNKDGVINPIASEDSMKAF